MTAIWQTAPGQAPNSVALGSPTAAQLQTWRFLYMLRNARRNRPAGNGEPPPADASAFRCWEEAALWMLMMH